MKLNEIKVPCKLIFLGSDTNLEKFGFSEGCIFRVKKVLKGAVVVCVGNSCYSINDFMAKGIEVERYV